MEPAASGAEYGEETPPVATTLFKFLTNFFLVRVTMDNKEAARKEDASRCFVVQGKRSADGRRMVARDVPHPPPPRTFHPFCGQPFRNEIQQTARKGTVRTTTDNPTGRNVAVGVVRANSSFCCTCFRRCQKTSKKGCSYQQSVTNSHADLILPVVVAFSAVRDAADCHHRPLRPW